MILITEVSHPGDVHVEVNSSFVEIISKIYPDEQIVFRAEKGHIAAVSKFFKDPRNLSFVGFEKYYDPKAFSWRQRIVGEIKEIKRSLKAGAQSDASTCAWTCIFPTGQFFLSLYLMLFNRRKTNHLIVLHGELEFLRDKRRKKTEAFLGFLQKCAIRLSPKNVRYIVLGDSIKTHLKAYFSERVLQKVIPILHPYHYDDNKQAILTRDCAKPVLLGTIGTQMLSKNSQHIFSLAEGMREDIVRGDFKFITIGKVLPELLAYKNEFVTQLYADSFVPPSIFEEEVNKLDFVLFFYDNNSYRLCPSGAIFEVIKLGKPVISTHNSYFDWLFEKYGKMGFLCRDINAMRLLIKEIKAGKRDNEINQVLETIRQFKVYNDLNAIAVDLAAKL